MATGDVIKKDLGIVTAYGYALAGGYKGTEDQFAKDFAAIMNGGSGSVTESFVIDATNRFHFIEYFPVSYSKIWASVHGGVTGLYFWFIPSRAITFGGQLSYMSAIAYDKQDDELDDYFYEARPNDTPVDSHLPLQGVIRGEGGDILSNAYAYYDMPMSNGTPYPQVMIGRKDSSEFKIGASGQNLLMATFVNRKFLSKT